MQLGPVGKRLFGNFSITHVELQQFGLYAHSYNIL
jgi:hypothetical protein